MYSATVWVTEMCNLNCKYCYEGKDKSRKKFNQTNIDQLIIFLEKTVLNKNDKVVVSFHGGEPLLEVGIIREITDRIDEIVRDNDVIVTYEMTTNGTVNTKTFLDYIKFRNDFEISVSLDGTKKTNDINRLTKEDKSTFESTFEFAKSLIQLGKNPRIRMTMTPDTIDFLTEDITFLLNNGFSTIVSVPDFFDHRWSTEDMKKIGLKLQEIYDLEEVKSNNMIKYNLLDESTCFRSLGKCSGGIDEVHISSDGKLYPCTYTMGLPDYCIGNIWDGIDKNKLGELSKVYEEKNMACDGCGLERSCSTARCKYLNKIITNNYNKPVPSICAFTNVLYRFWKNVYTNSNNVKTRLGGQ